MRNVTDEVRKAAEFVKSKGVEPCPLAIMDAVSKRGATVSLEGVLMVLKRMGFKPRVPRNRPTPAPSRSTKALAHEGTATSATMKLIVSTNPKQVAKGISDLLSLTAKADDWRCVFDDAVLAALSGKDVIDDARIRIWNEVTQLLQRHQEILKAFKQVAAVALSRSLDGELQGELYLDEVDSLTNDVAEILSSAGTEYSKKIGLNGITKLSPETARILASTLRYLELNGLATVSLAIAKELAQQESDDEGIAVLRLGGLKDLPDAAAKALARHEGLLLLEGLRRLSSYPLAYKLLNQRPGCEHDEAWHANPSEYGGAELFLDELKSLPPSFIKAMNSLARTPREKGAPRKGFRTGLGTLSLNGLKKLTPKEASCLTQHSGDLSLDGLKTVSPEVATVLAKHTGGLSLMGLTKPSQMVELVLRSNKNISLSDKSRRKKRA
jgi:hypothetical protein